MYLNVNKCFAILIFAIVCFAVSTGLCEDEKWFATFGLPCPENGTVLLGTDGDLSNWEMEKGGGDVAWNEKDGVMTVGSGDIITRDKIGDCRIHLEFKVPRGSGNSGVYIQQRYEVQILNSYGKKPGKSDCGAIYKQQVPAKNACNPAGEWQTYDILFRQPRWSEDGDKVENARISVMHNGILIHDDVEIPNKTGAGKGEGPGERPLRLQDHGDPVQFRNIWIVDIDED